MKTILNALKYKTLLGFYIYFYAYRIVRYFKYDRLNDADYLKMKFKRKQGYALDLKNPITLNEKIQWLKIHDRKDFHTICADKFKARFYLESKVGDQYLIPLAFETTKISDIKKENMPDYPFVLKANHDAGNYRIIRDVNTVDWKKLRYDCREWLMTNYYYADREWQYKNIERRIIVEKLLLCENGKIPNDYKVHCINGKVVFIYVSYGREEKNKRYIYNSAWQPLDFTWAERSKDVSTIKGEEIEPPKSLQEMIRLAEIVAVDFPKYIRVDFYDVDGKLYFGEITQHHGGGFDQIKPFEADIHYGSMISLE